MQMRTCLHWFRPKARKRWSTLPLLASLLVLLYTLSPHHAARSEIRGIHTGDLLEPRIGHTATKLPGGRVLVVGGISGGGQASAELYTPSTGTWTQTGSLRNGRGGHTATILPNGSVLVVGGYNGIRPLSSAEIYDPASGTWRETGSLTVGRDEHTATLLTDGRVLVVGGYSNRDEALDSAEIYDPATGVWTQVGARMQTARYDHTASVISGGRVLVAGGLTDNPISGETTTDTAEVFDPATGTWSSVGTLNVGRYAHTATVLENGKVFVAGGRHDTARLSSTEQFDPSTNSWTSMGSLSIARSGHTATLTAGNALLLVGGLDGAGRLASNELYEPSTNVWQQASELNVARNGHTATPLSGSVILVAGGSGTNGASLTSVELYEPGVTIVAEPIPDSTVVPDDANPPATPGPGDPRDGSPQIYLPVIQTE